MRALAYWAHDHPRSAQLIIGICHLLLALTAILSGVLYYVLGLHDLEIPLLIATNLFFILYFFYPVGSIGRGKGRTNLVRRKLYDFGLVYCTWIVICLGLGSSLAGSTDNVRPDSVGQAIPIVHKSKQFEKKSSLKNWWSSVKNKISKVRTKIKTNLHLLKMAFSRENNGGLAVLKFFLVVLTLTTAWFLGYWIAVLSCSLSCSGQHGLAWTVLFLGWGSIIWLGFIAIKAIFRMKPKEELNETTTT